MSCILYNLASYSALTKCPTFSELWRDLFASTYYASPEDFAEALFNLNARAFCDRYREDLESSEDVAGARGETHIEGTFKDYIKADTSTLEPQGLARLWQVFSRIEYQYSDAHDSHDLEAYWHLGWAKDWCARALCEHVERRAA